MTPRVSVIIPTYNEEARIEKCLGSILNMYPKEGLDIIIVDDRSTDRTVEISERMGARIFQNGTKHIERGKSIGLENAMEEYVLFVDADNEFKSSNWLRDAIAALEENDGLVGVQMGRFEYKRNDSLPNRYSSLFGINDPFVFYLRRRGVLMHGEDEWPYPHTVVRKADTYFLVRFTSQNMPTLGSQAFLTKKSLIMKTDWSPYFFHMDSLLDLVSRGENLFAITKEGTYHDYSANSFDMFRKWRRNIALFHKYSSRRKYRYELNTLRTVKTVLLMITLAVPVFDALRNYARNRDPASLMHPIYCVAIVVINSIATIEHMLGHSKQEDEA
jgi:glycosyltransferase involved in cell wall biosynthesis